MADINPLVSGFDTTWDHPIERQRDLWDYYSQCPTGQLKTWSFSQLFDEPGTKRNLRVYPSRSVGLVQPAYRGKQVTVSEKHNWDPRSRKPRELGDVGGPFYSESSHIRVSNPTRYRITNDVQSQSSNFIRDYCEYVGPVFAFPPELAVMPPSPASSKAALEKMGATAIARVKPTNSVADAATFLIELRKEGLPKIAGSKVWKEKSLAGRNIGEEYLNLEFGWKPMINDIKDILQGIRHARSVLQQYERASGSFVRRRYVFPATSSVSVTEGTANDFVSLDTCPALHISRTPAVYKIRDEITRQVWFSGAFTYHLPTGWKSRNAIDRLAAKADALMGIDLTPEVLWNVTPWSWAVDWFSNAGDVISNLSDWSTDGLVLKYGYVMEHSSHVRTYYHDSAGTNPRQDIIGSPVIATRTVKQRHVATPFGFGLNWDGFTPRQWAITTALGLTRGRK
jgi:hypothetical protein